jgi:hypothetical protein
VFNAIGKGAPPALLVNGVSCHAEYFCELFRAEGFKFFFWYEHVFSFEGSK